MRWFATRLLMTMAMLLGTAGIAAAQDAPMQLAGTTAVKGEQVIELITKTADLVVLDNRKPEDYAAGHIEGAIRLIDTDVTPETLAKHVAGKTTPVLFYCNGLKCGRAAKAAQKAVEAGYTKVYYYALGMDEWNTLGLPVVKNTASK